MVVGESRAALISAKVRVPPVADRLIERPRLDALITEMLAGHRPLFICATAGSGKTTAVAQALRGSDLPVAWLTVDSTDAAPGRLLTYLEAALASRIPGAAGVATAAMRQRVPQREAAGLLAEATQGASVVMVVDELERLASAPAALAVLGAFIRYAPPTLRLILISRQEPALDLSSNAALGGAAAIGEDDLAFTSDEARAALATIGSREIDPAAAVEATGGWVAGVLFEAWRSSEHVAGIGGEADPLHGYLASQVFDQLGADEQELLVRTALLTDVTPDRADALGCDDAAAVLTALRAKHLPVTWRGGAMRCHTRFREYLLARLERRSRSDVKALRRAHGKLLEEEGHHEDAVEAYLAAGSLESALRASGGALDGVVERLDFPVAERWLRALRPIAGADDDKLWSAELMLAIAREHYGEGARLADRLRDGGELDLVVARSDHAAKMLAWCLWHVGRVDDARAIVDQLGDEDTAALRYLLHLVDTRGAALEPELNGGPMDALIRRVRYAHGRLHDAADPPASRWAAAVTAPWRIGALRALGRLDDALVLYDGETFAEWAPVWFGAIVAPELMTDLGREQEAREAIVRGRALIRTSGSLVFDMLNRLIEARLELRLARDHERADAVLLALAARPEASAYGFIAEQVATWSGMVLLLRNQDEAAARRLRRAVRAMQSTDRILELPTAAVFLAEAEWRLGNEEASDLAADIAAIAAERQGSDHLLLQALADFPAVASRRLDADADADSRWHDLGRVLLARHVPVTVRGRARVVFDEFSGPGLFVDGVAVQPRIKKSYELLAYLLSAVRESVPREEVLGALFGERNDSSVRSYLRQAAHQLREVLPEDVQVVAQRDRLQLAGAGSVESAYAKVEQLLARAPHQPGAARLDLLEQALRVLDSGEYLGRITSAWVVERRDRLARVTADARHQAAKAAYDLGRYPLARDLAEAVIQADPYRESTWRLLMRVRHALGDSEGVVVAFRRCERALHELGASPSPTTGAVLTALRK